jgi:hypothetical protein
MARFYTIHELHAALFSSAISTKYRLLNSSAAHILFAWMRGKERDRISVSVGTV